MNIKKTSPEYLPRDLFIVVPLGLPAILIHPDRLLALDLCDYIYEESSVINTKLSCCSASWRTSR